nr:phage tail tape measure protein [Halomonas profundi]
MAGGFSLRRVISETADFEDSILGLQAVSGATVGQINQLEQQARSLGATSMHSAKQSADAQRFLAQAGFDVNEVLAATPSVLSLATAGQMDLAQAADIASNVLGGMRLEVDQLNRVNNVMAATSARSNTNIMQLGEAFSYAGPFAASAGVSIETTSAAIGVLSDAGLQASRAGTGLIGIIRQLSNVTPQAAGVLASYGLTIEDVNIEAHGLETVLERIRDANISTADAFAIFGSEAGAAAQILAAGAGRVREFSGELNDVEGAVDRMAQIIGSGLTGSIRGFNSMLSESVLQLGESGVGGAFGLVIDNATGVLAVYNDMLPALAEANDLTDEQVARIEALAGGIDLLGDALIITGGILAGRYAGAVGTVTVAKLAATQQTVAYQLALARMSGVSATAAAGQLALAGATRAAAGALALVGGPLGAAVIAAGAIYYFRDELGLTQRQAGLTEDQVADLRAELTEMNQEDLGQSVAALNAQLEETTLKAAAAREQLAQLRSENRGSGVLGFESGSIGAEVRGMQAVADATAQLTAIEQQRALALQESGSRAFKPLTEWLFELDDANQGAANSGDQHTESITKQTDAAKALAKATEAQAKSLEDLRNRLIPGRREVVQLAQDMQTLTLAIAMGTGNVAQNIQMMGLLQQQYIEAQKDTDDLADKTVKAAFTMEGAWDEVRLNGLRRLDDGFADLWESAIGGSMNAGELMKKALIQTLAEMAHIAITRPITVQLATSMGFGGTGIQAGGSGGGFGINPGSIGNAWNAVQGGFNSIQWGGAGGASAYGGTGFANAATSGTGATGYFGGSMQNFSGMQGLAGAGAGFAGSWGAGQVFGESQAQQIGSTIGAVAGTYIGGPIGSAIGSFLGGGVGSLFGSSPTAFSGRFGTTATLNRSEGAGKDGVFEHQSGGQFYGQSALGYVGFRDQGTERLQRAGTGNKEWAEELTNASVEMDNLVASIARSPAELDRMRSAVQGIERSSNRAADIIDFALNERPRAAIDAMSGDFGRFVQGLSGSIEEVVQQAQFGQQAHTALSNSMERLNLQFNAAGAGAFEAASNIAQYAGGIDNLATLQGQYYQAFFSEAERAASLQDDLTASLNAMGLTLPQNVASYRALVEAQNLNTESGQRNYVQLLQLSSGFTQLQDMLGSTATGVRDFTAELSAARDAVSSAEDQVRRAYEVFSNQAFGQQIELLNLMGDSSGALALERERELATIDEALRPTQERIWAIQDEIAAQQNATAAARNYQRELTRVRDQLSQQFANIGNWLDQQQATSGTPESNLATAQEQLAKQLVLAENGDRNALQNITQYAQQVLEANRDYNASSAAGQRIQQDVYDAIAGLPAAISAEQFIADEIKAALREQTQGISTQLGDVLRGDNPSNIAGNLASYFETLTGGIDGVLTREQLAVVMSGKASDAQLTAIMRAVDLNGDGVMSGLESVIIQSLPSDTVLGTVLRNKMNELDKNQLTSAQIRTALSPIATDAEIKRLIREVDVNGDGIITKQELGNARLSGLAGGIGATLKPMFDSIDLDASGFIDWNEFYGAFQGLASDGELRKIFQKLDADGSGTISRLEALNRSSDGTESNTDSMEKQARDQLKELNSLVGEMTRTTDQFVGLNSTMVSLRDSINALGVAQADVARIEKERAAAEQKARVDLITNRADAAWSGLNTARDTAQQYQQTIDKNQDRNVIGQGTSGSYQLKRGGLAQHYYEHSNVSEMTSLDHLLSGTASALANPGGLASISRVNQLLSEYNTAYNSLSPTTGQIKNLESDIVGLRAQYRELTGKKAPFATGGIFDHGRVVDTSTSFSIGEMGEAGPEMILPVEKMSNGKYGMQARLGFDMPSLPSFPLLGNNDVLETLRDLKHEVAELRRDNAQLQSESNKHLAAANNQRGAAAKGQIGAIERGNKMLKKMEDDKRLEAAKR